MIEVSDVTFPLELKVPATKLLEFHRDASVLAHITPLSFLLEMTPASGPLSDGLVVSSKVKLLGTTVWKGQIEKVRVDGFVDTAENVGVFKTWRHRHIITGDENSSKLEDKITYEAKPGLEWLAPILLKGLFSYRHNETRRILGG